ncbi:hypothetical protein MUU72_31645 [Streptomyces sp. RS10V-4]|uniref:hypothetical protein n=1 Tax=Streptomyces rhizoryzae TaxID=2932493 RepID=UPI0020053DC6|nr:hypothetical protein [Streptomyces rhizoryzae]MCK7627596.1 hypothetical protein [Streptomyces rhizoryzae]
MLDEVVQAYGAGVLSVETAVAMLMDAGYPIKGAAEEVVRIREAAVQKQQAVMAAVAPGAVSEGHGQGAGGMEHITDRGRARSGSRHQMGGSRQLRCSTVTADA